MKNFLLPQIIISLAFISHAVIHRRLSIRDCGCAVSAQTRPLLPDLMVQQFCCASQITRGTEYDAVTVIALSWPTPSTSTLRW